MDWDWRFINTLAPWFSAIGTVSAVVTSLYLARRSDRQMLEVRAGLRTIAVVRGGSSGVKDYPFFVRPNVFSNQPPTVLMVSVTNIGRRTAHLAHIYWQVGRGRSFDGHPPRNELSFEFPIKLADGESAFYSWPLAGLEKSFIFGDSFAGCGDYDCF